VVCHGWVVTDFGIAKVIGGAVSTWLRHRLLTKQVVGQQNFEMGRGGRHGACWCGRARLRDRPHRATAGRWRFLFRARAVPYEPKGQPRGATPALLGLLPCGDRPPGRRARHRGLGRRFITYWPYNLSRSNAAQLRLFSTFDQSGWGSYYELRDDGGARRDHRDHESCSPARIWSRDQGRPRAGA